MTKTVLNFLLSLTCCFSLSVAEVSANKNDRPLLHDLFTSHMVLQRDQKNVIWGWSTPNSPLNITMAGSSTTVTTDDTGKWTAEIGPFKAGGPYELIVKGAETKKITDILMGDVWLCSGQSNMGMSVKQVRNAKVEITQANHPAMRLFTVPRAIEATASSHFNGAVRWQAVTSKSIGNFSAACYFMGRHLHKELGVPIGLINSSWGGTTAESWTGNNAIGKIGDFKGNLARLETYAADPEKAELERQQITESWWQKNDRGSKPDASWADPHLSDKKWKTVTLPAVFPKVGLGKFKGSIWFRKTITIKNKAQLKKSQLILGRIVSSDTTWVNGIQLKRNLTPAYNIPGHALKIGKNVIAIRVLYEGAHGPDLISAPVGGFRGKKKNFKMLTAGQPGRNLSGKWKYKIGSRINNDTPPIPPRPFGEIHKQVSVLYNGMIAPLTPLAIKGIAWYQGEANTGRAKQYEQLLPAMITDWRQNFKQNLPFLIVQISSFNDPRKRDWAALRHAQYIVATADPLAELAVTIDIGNARNIHPENKQDVGKRLALAALHLAHDKNIVYSGPVYKSYQKIKNKLYLEFDHRGGGLAAGENGLIQGFALCLIGNMCQTAAAKIDHDRVIVTLPNNAVPVALRYAWGKAPVNNLRNREGLPAVPFKINLNH